MVPVGVRFELFVDDIERSLAFYGAALGLQPSPGCDPQGYVPVSAGRVRIGLQRRSALSAQHHFRPAHFAGPRGVGVEIVVEVDDVDGWRGLVPVMRGLQGWTALKVVSRAAW